MKSLRLCIGIVICIFFAGCTYGPHSLTEPKPPAPAYNPEKIKAESDRLDAVQNQLKSAIEMPGPREVDVEPVLPAYDPLQDHMVSFSMVKEKFELVLYSLAQSVGMNLIIDPTVSTEERLLTVNFENVSAATVLKEILGTYDLYYEIEENLIRIRPYQEKIFYLNFLDTAVSTNFDVGGDVFGGGETETASGLSGNFRLSGTGAKSDNPYDVLESMVKKIVSKGGRYSLNRLSGSLYIKDKPSVILSASKLINHFRAMLSRQILIEARIIEVSLSEEYRYGIDWNFLRQKASGIAEATSAEWSLGTGMILSDERTVGNYDLSIGATIDALNTFGDTRVVSNPSIRSKHGKPSIISVGTSFTYKKSVEVTSSTDADNDTETTEVEVSTVFDGLILGVIPFIEENGRITLLINPIKSDVDQTSLEPESVGSDQSISLPEVSVKEISTTIALNSGDLVILGGLIDKHLTSENQGIPFLSAIPVLGYLFKNDLKSEEVRELVIILRVTLV